MLVTRIAPTPSGYLHAGNAVNFLLTDWLARRADSATVHLRIDDMNLPAAPDEFLADIFWAVDWLGIGVTEGPSGVADFRANHSQLDRTDEYRAELEHLRDAGLVYVCSCSRNDVAGRPAGTPDPCLQADLGLVPGVTALRFRTQGGPHVPAAARGLAAIGCPRADVSADMGDFVVWRRDDLPSYQLASVLEDRRRRVDTVVRGADLLTSSAAQLLMADALSAPGLLRARFVHHSLLADPAGAKLSKRDDADALRSIARTPGGRDRLWRTAADIGAHVGIIAPI